MYMESWMIERLIVSVYEVREGFWARLYYNVSLGFRVTDYFDDLGLLYDDVRRIVNKV